MSQITAPRREMLAGRAGLQAEPIQPDSIVTKIQPDASLFFGRLVVQDAGDDEVKHPDAASQSPIGVVAASLTEVDNGDGLDPNYSAKSPAMVLTKGKVWVVIEEDIVVGDAVFFRHTAGTGSKLGAFRNDADTASCEELTNARWAKGGTAAQGIALLELAPL